MYMLTNPFACSRVELFEPDTSNTTCSSTVWHHTPPGTVWGSVHSTQATASLHGDVEMLLRISQKYKLQNKAL